MSNPESAPPPSPDSGLPSYALEDLSWPEVRELLDVDPRMLLPVGALDQHGPHLPLGTSSYLAERAVRDLSEAEGILRAPALRYGVDLPGADRYAGTAGISRKTLHRIVNQLLAAWEDHGVEELIIVSAHSYEPHLDALLMALTSEATTTVVDLRSIPVDDLLDGDPDEEHGGELETSLLLHLDPARVRTEAVEDFVPARDTLRKYVRSRAVTPPPGSRGAVGRPSRATAARGRAVYERWISTVRARILDGDAP